MADAIKTLRTPNTKLTQNLCSFFETFTKNPKCFDWTIILTGHGISPYQNTQGYIADMTYTELRKFCTILNKTCDC